MKAYSLQEVTASIDNSMGVKKGKTASVSFVSVGGYRYAFKKYRSGAVDNLRTMETHICSLFDALGEDKYNEMMLFGAFPRCIVRDAGEFCGFLMDVLPRNCYNAENEDRHLGRFYGIEGEVNKYSDKQIGEFIVRLGTVIFELHKSGYVLGDALNDQNLYVRVMGNELYPYFVDTDSLRKDGANPAKTYHSPNFEPPEGEDSLSTKQSDIYKYCLIALRIFSKPKIEYERAGLLLGDAGSEESIQRINNTLGTRFGDAIRKGLSKNPADRPQIRVYYGATRNDPPKKENGIKVAVNTGKEKSSKPITPEKPDNTNTIRGNSISPRKTASEHALLKKLKRINYSFIYNIIAAVVWIVLMAFSHFNILSLSVGGYILTYGMPLVAFYLYYLPNVFNNDDKDHDFWSGYGNALLLSGLLCFALMFFSKNSMLLSKLNLVSLHVFTVMSLCLPSIKYLEFLTKSVSTNRNREDRRLKGIFGSNKDFASNPIKDYCSKINIKAYENMTYLFLVVFVFTIIGIYNGIKTLNPLNIGEIIVLGAYEQDGYSANGSEGLTWTVQKIEDGKALLISNMCIEALPYNADGSDNSWTNSSIRKWLNSDFYNSAFSSEEKNLLIESEIATGRLIADTNAKYGETYGDDEITVDRIFLPVQYKGGEITEEIPVTQYALERFKSNNSLYGQEKNLTMLWIRQPYGETSNYAQGYNAEEEKQWGYICNQKSYALIRPSMYIDVNAYLNYKKTDKASADSDLKTSNPGDSKEAYHNNNLNAISETSELYVNDIYYYHSDVRSLSDDSETPYFGPSCWEATSGKTDDERIYALENEFFERISKDPVLAAACYVYIFEINNIDTGDRSLGNMSDINEKADMYITDPKLWQSEIRIMQSYLQSLFLSSVSVDEVKDAHVLSFCMKGDTKPVVSWMRYQWSDTVTMHYLTFTMNTGRNGEGNIEKEFDLSFIIEDGFEPVILNVEE